MALDELIPVIVQYGNNAIYDFETKVYADIASAVTSRKPIVVDAERFTHLKEDEVRKAIALEVAGIVGDRPALIQSRKHYMSGLCYDRPEVTMVTFDAHNDSERDNDYGYTYFNGSFLDFRKGRSFALGTYVKTNSSKTKPVSPGRSARQAMRIVGDVYLSLDVDAYSKQVTEAFKVENNLTLFDALKKSLGLRTNFRERDVLDISRCIAKNANVVGLDISEYVPEMEIPPYVETEKDLANLDPDTLPTVRVLKDYLRNVCSEMYRK